MNNDSIIRAKCAARDFLRYYDDPEYAEEMEERAEIATDGNVSGLDAIVSSLVEALKPFTRQDLVA